MVRPEMLCKGAFQSHHHGSTRQRDGGNHVVRHLWSCNFTTKRDPESGRMERTTTSSSCCRSRECLSTSPEIPERAPAVHHTVPVRQWIGCSAAAVQIFS